MKQRGAEFIRGATRPSLGALLGAACVGAALLGVCAWGITPHLIATKPGYFEVDKRDEFAHLTARTLQIAESPVDGTSVVIIGDSSVREAISSPEDLEQQLLEKSGQHVTVKLLAAGGLTQWGTVAITDNIRDHIKGVVLLEISPYNLSMDEEPLTEYERTVAVESEAFRDEIRKFGLTPPPHTGNYFIDNYRFFVARPACLWNLVYEPLNPPQHFIEHPRAWSRRQWARAYARVWAWVPHYDENKARNLAIYQRMIERLRKNRGITVALYETIESPQIQSLAHGSNDKKTKARYYTDMAAFLHENHLELLDVASEAEVGNRDFWDPFHMMTDNARRRYTAALANRLAELLAPPTTQSTAQPLEGIKK